MSQGEHLGEDLAAFVGLSEALEGERRAQHEAHLLVCAACRAEVEALRQVSAALETPALSPSPDFDARLFQRLDAIDRTEAKEARREAFRAFFRPSRLALALGPIAAGALWFVASRPRQEEEPEPRVELGVFAELEGLELGAELELYSELDAAEYLDVAEDLELLLDPEEGEAG